MKREAQDRAGGGTAGRQAGHSDPHRNGTECPSSISPGERKEATKAKAATYGLRLGTPWPAPAESVHLRPLLSCGVVASRPVGLLQQSAGRKAW